jgi:large subunit ribosomal protein L5
LRDRPEGRDDASGYGTRRIGMAKKKAAPDQAEASASATATRAVATRPRLQRFYGEQVLGKLMKEFSYSSPMEIPRLEKIVINVGIGEASKNAKLLESVVEEVGLITGQRPVVRKAKKAISNFGLREGVPVGVSVTLRKERMWEFLDRFVNVAVPRIRDFRGLPSKSFDGRGNFTIGVREQLIFPEINYDKVNKIHGMDITFVTSAKRDDEGMALLRELGMPFRGETPIIVNA